MEDNGNNKLYSDSDLSDKLCIGDYICLYCEDTSGFVFSDQSSATCNTLFVHADQDRDKPDRITNVHGVTFQVVTQNRYKLKKKYRKLKEQYGEETEDEEVKHMLQRAKVAAATEQQDNSTEQNRQHGKRVKYGEIIQLRHVFSDKYIHISTTETSVVDKNKMMVTLESYSSKNAHFRFLPRYKVKAEGEQIEMFDQIALESTKIPGSYLHSSGPTYLSTNTFGYEINLAVEMTTLTLLKHSRTGIGTESFLRGGAIFRMFHKDLEAYLTAEGVFGERPDENVHLRVREINNKIPRTLHPPRSGIVYWQIESNKGIISGDRIKWESQVRLRHMTTRLYLTVTENLEVKLTADVTDPNTFFRFHCVTQDLDSDCICFEQNARIEHVLTGSWLHGSNDERYDRMRYTKRDGSLMDTLKWDGSVLHKVTCSAARRYPDAFTIQGVAKEPAKTFNYVAGMMPFIRKLTEDRYRGVTLAARHAAVINTTLRDMKDLMIVDGKPNKETQKLFRNLKVVDQLVKLLHCPLAGTADWPLFSEVCQEVYEVLHAYTQGNSRKNALYFARYINFFMTQLYVQGGVGLQCCIMLIDLIKDNRSIVDRITPEDITSIISLVKESKHYKFLELLEVLCVCNGISITQNQTLIAELLLVHHKDCMHHIGLGQDIEQRADNIYVSTDNRRSWIPLHLFIYKSNPEYSELKCLFLERQLELFKHLCYGRNERAIHLVTRSREFFTWEVAFQGLQTYLLPDKIRARFCDLIVGLFVDVGDNYSVTELSSNNFVYSELSAEEPGMPEVSLVPKNVDDDFPGLQEWLRSFFQQNDRLIHSNPQKNLFAQQVLKLVTYLVQYGYMGSREELIELKEAVLNYVTGWNDVPFPHDIGARYSKAEMQEVKKFRKGGRFKPGLETDAIVEAKIQGLELLELLLVKQFNSRIRYFVSVFKDAEMRDDKRKKKRHAFGPLMKKSFDSGTFWRKPVLRGKIERFMKNMERETDILGSDLPDILFDLTNYDSDSMTTKSLSLLSKFYSLKSKLFSNAISSQLLTSIESTGVHRYAVLTMVQLRRFARSKVDRTGLAQMCEIMDNYKELCHIPNMPNIPHPIGQNILINNGMLRVLLGIFGQEIDLILTERYEIACTIIRKALVILRYLAVENEHTQKWILTHFDALLQTKACGPDLALALRQCFVGRPAHSLKLHPYQIQTMVRLAAEYKEKAPELLQLMETIVKDQSTGMVLKRNQSLVSKYLMDSFKSAAYVMNVSQEQRLDVLIGKKGLQHQKYLISLVSLLATCAEGESRYVESLCQAIVSMEEILTVLNNRFVTMHNKAPYARYMVWAYMKTARTVVESGVESLPHDKKMWKHIKILLRYIQKTVRLHPTSDEDQSSSPEPSLTTVEDGQNENVPTSKAFVGHDFASYMLSGGFLLVETLFAKFYKPDPHIYPEEKETLKSLLASMPPFCQLLAKYYARHRFQFPQMTGCVEVLAKRLSKDQACSEGVQKFLEESNTQEVLHAAQLDLEQTCDPSVNRNEMELNAMLNRFAEHFQQYTQGENTIAYQLNVTKSKASKETEYVTAEDDMPLPLGKEFQCHAKCFITPKEKLIAKKFGKAGKLVQQLHISATSYQEKAPPDQEELDLNSLRILRTMIYNLIVRLPQGWKENPNRYKRILDDIRDVQLTLQEFGIVGKVMPLIRRNNADIGREVLALMDVLLFNASEKVQEAVIEYFMSTQEEIFFVFVRERMQLASMAIKERRSVDSQLRARENRAKEIREKLKALPTESKPEKNKDETDAGFKLNVKFLKQKSMQGFLMRLRSNLLIRAYDAMEMENLEDEELEISNPVMTPVFGKDADDLFLEQGPEKDMYLIVRVLAGLCDGQYQPLQDYLRTQPDNIRKVNLVADTTLFISSLYSHVTGNTIDLLTQIFSTLNECAQGNNVNRVVIVNGKIIDYINFLLRMGHFEDCTPEQVIELKMDMGLLLHSLIEENNPEASAIAQDIRDTLDLDAVQNMIAQTYGVNMTKKKVDPNLLTTPADLIEELTTAKTSKLSFLNTSESKKNTVSKELKENLTEVGFLYTIILARMYDIDPMLEKKGFCTPLCKEAYRYYKDQCMSVEIVKDNELQNVHFRVKDVNLIREEIKEQAKWNIDRSSPSSKLRDLLGWSRDIVSDISYQKTILKNPVVAQLAKRWAIWNYAQIFLSFLISILMLVTWKAPYSMGDIPDDAPEDFVPDNEIHNPNPNTTSVWADSDLAMLILGIAHNVCSFMLLVAYLLLKHPKLPDIKGTFTKLCGCCSFAARDEEEIADGEEPHVKVHKNNLEVKLISPITFYYLGLFALSLAGTVLGGYFYAINLINIVANNQLLKGVVRAVTLNGRSLLWVAVLALIIIFWYGLVSFAFYRHLFIPDEGLYCEYLYECVVTVLRYGVVGDIGDNIAPNDYDHSFLTFTLVTIYQVIFFIIFTTIGLNIIFGIIVDTFSELRDVKWAAEKDMRDTCFICSRDSYDFEHAGKGFLHHVKNEHNMWAYVFYFIHLAETKENDYTALDLYVAELLKDDKLEFFPMNRALGLANLNENSTEDMIEEVMKAVQDIQRRQLKQEYFQRRATEKEQEKRWHEWVIQGRMADVSNNSSLPAASEKDHPVTASQQVPQSSSMVAPTQSPQSSSMVTPTQSQPSNLPMVEKASPGNASVQRAPISDDDHPESYTQQLPHASSTGDPNQSQSSAPPTVNWTQSGNAWQRTLTDDQHVSPTQLLPLTSSEIDSAESQSYTAPVVQSTPPGNALLQPPTPFDDDHSVSPTQQTHATSEGDSTHSRPSTPPVALSMPGTDSLQLPTTSDDDHSVFSPPQLPHTTSESDLTHSRPSTPPKVQSASRSHSSSVASSSEAIPTSSGDHPSSDFQPVVIHTHDDAGDGDVGTGESII